MLLKSTFNLLLLFDKAWNIISEDKSKWLRGENVNWETKLILKAAPEQRGKTVGQKRMENVDYAG